MYELAVGAGFIMRLMIDQMINQAYWEGCGWAAMTEVIRRLRLSPKVEMIATSHLRENMAAAQLYQALGFVAWDIAYATADAEEVYLRLP